MRCSYVMSHCSAIQYTSIHKKRKNFYSWFLALCHSFVWFFQSQHDMMWLKTSCNIRSLKQYFLLELATHIITKSLFLVWRNKPKQASFRVTFIKPSLVINNCGTKTITKYTNRIIWSNSQIFAWCSMLELLKIQLFLSSITLTILTLTVLPYTILIGSAVLSFPASSLKLCN